jgi:hypothetical protein
MVHASYYSLLAVTAILGLIPTRFNEIILAICLLGLLGVGITAAIRQRQSTLPARLQNLTLWSFGIGIAALVVGYFVRIFVVMNYVMNHPRARFNQNSFYQMPAYRGYLEVVEVIALCLGVAGLAVTLQYFFNRRRAGSSPSESVTPGL